MSDEQSSASASEHVASPGDVLCGKYRVDRVIGRGGMGVVMEAFHLQFDERVAIKFLSPSLGKNAEAQARFEREARVLFKIKSPHVCRVLDVGKLDNGGPFLVMEYLEGEDLATKLVNRQATAIEDAIDYVVQASEAVGEAHARGIVHRDIKPENLFLAKGADGAPCIKVLDFGLSKIAQSDPNAPRQRSLTNTEQAMGTPHYMSPEQWLSARDVGPPSDQWALAVILYELVCGAPPFEGEQLAHVCSQVLHGTMPSLVARAPHVPPALEQAIRRALDKDPMARFHNLGHFAAAIAPYGRSDSRAIAERILRMFEQADALLQSAEFTRSAALSGSFAAFAASTMARQSQPEMAAPAPATTLPMGPATVPIPQTLHQAPAPPPQVRAQTAQSWQQQLPQAPLPPAPAGSRTGKGVAIALGLLLLAGGVGGGLIYLRDHRHLARAASSDAPAAVEPRPADREPAATTAARGDARPASTAGASSASAAASASGAASAVGAASASASSSAAAPPKYPPWHAPPLKLPPRPPPKAPPPKAPPPRSPPPPPPPTRKPSIFDGR